MTQEKLQELYDVVYEYTGMLDDTALNILDEVIDEMGVEHIADAFFDETLMSVEDAELLGNAFIIAAERCAEEC